MEQATMTQEELEQKLAALGGISDEQRCSVACSLIGHSHYVTTCFGYQYCGRCGAQIGDTLGGIGRRGVVSAQHLRWGDCEECEKARPSLTWVDTYLLTEEAQAAPFATRAEAETDYEAAKARLAARVQS